MIIKPIVVVNNTHSPIPDKNSTVIPMSDLFENEDEDCDILKVIDNFEQHSTSGLIKSQSNIFNKLPKFKQISKGIEIKKTKMQRKFYRKVAIGEMIYSIDTFKQGLNLIIVQRDKMYTKCKKLFYFNLIINIY